MVEAVVEMVVVGIVKGIAGTVEGVVEMVVVVFEIVEVVSDFDYLLAVIDQTRNMIVILTD